MSLNIKHINRNELEPGKVYMEFENITQNAMEEGSPTLIDEETGEKLELYAKNGKLKTRKAGG